MAGWEVESGCVCACVCVGGGCAFYSFLNFLSQGLLTDCLLSVEWFLWVTVPNIVGCRTKFEKKKKKKKERKQRKLHGDSVTI